jgi:1,4-dihydroxy-2-naphthoate octaprenyltransferase
VTPLAVLMGSATGFLATAILVLNNLRDIESDEAAGKLTLATRIGRHNTRIVLTAVVAGAFAIVIAVPGGRLAVLAFPLCVLSLRDAFVSTQPSVLIGALKRMAAAELVFALLFALGLLL